MNDRHEDSCEKNMRYTHYYGVAQIRNHVDMAIEMDIDVEYLGDQIQNGTYLHTFASVAQRRVNLLVRSGHSGGCKSTKDAERECHKLGDLRCKSDHDGMRGVRMLRRSKQEELTIGYDPSLQSRFSSITILFWATTLSKLSDWKDGFADLEGRARQDVGHNVPKTCPTRIDLRYHGRSVAQTIAYVEGRDAEVTRRRIVATRHLSLCKYLKMGAPWAGMDGEHEKDSLEIAGSGAKEEVAEDGSQERAV
ncbi:uncharacterized protein F5891DRAFT_983219 [Suillus fuscotomentosus]|uniref:Uncharacterized protein n=1 Tax=Suillus fuscotomentosus TaxID=1912939 RepID=A0AAD4E1Z3_9AGAM|nr:uncharacterized protein F5891DRAFT_983219 [Suillus fuscotomentosus]KAG1896808.1 hypothetical protein F5891DRAFT_983219 [Suillus fuscotomentosus]